MWIRLTFHMCYPYWDRILSIGLQYWSGIVHIIIHAYGLQHNAIISKTADFHCQVHQLVIFQYSVEWLVSDIDVCSMIANAHSIGVGTNSFVDVYIVVTSCEVIATFTSCKPHILGLKMMITQYNCCDIAHIYSNVCIITSTPVVTHIVVDLVIHVHNTCIIAVCVCPCPLVALTYCIQCVYTIVHTYVYIHTCVHMSAYVHSCDHAHVC